MEPSPFNRKLGIASEDLADGRVRLVLETDASFVNEVGIVHGAAPMMLLDGAMGRCCARTLRDGERCATVQISVLFLAAAAGRLTSIATVTKRGKRIVFVEGECHREDGTLVARAQGTWAIVPAE